MGLMFQFLAAQATWPREVRSLASEFLKRPIHIQTGAVHEMTVPAASNKGQGVKRGNMEELILCQSHTGIGGKMA